MRATLGTEWTDGCEGEWPSPVASTEPIDLPVMEDAAELISKPIVLPDDVIEGVLHRGAKMVLGGGSKTFKTWTLVDLAISVATTGRAWLAKFQTKRGRVLYINLELQGAFFAKRLRDVCNENHVNPELGYLIVWNLRGKAADLSRLRPLLLQRITQNEYVPHNHRPDLQAARLAG